MSLSLQLATRPLIREDEFVYTIRNAFVVLMMWQIYVAPYYPYRSYIHHIHQIHSNSIQLFGNANIYIKVFR